MQKKFLHQRFVALESFRESLLQKTSDFAAVTDAKEKSVVVRGDIKGRNERGDMDQRVKTLKKELDKERML